MERARFQLIKNKVVYTPRWINDLSFISDLDSSEAFLVMSNITNGLDIKDFDIKISSSPDQPHFGTDFKKRYNIKK